jgi:hypothetical protein
MGLRIDPNARFEREKQRARQEETGRQQLAREAIARKFAAQGLQGSGADIRITQQAQEEGAKRLSERFGEIESRQEAEALQRQQIEETRKFAREERLGSQQFAAEQARLGREQQATQFAEQMGFSREQFAEQMGFSREQFKEAKAQFQKQFDLQAKDFDLREGLTEQQAKLAEQAATLAQEQFDFQKQTENFNAVQSVLNQFLKPGQTLNKSQVDALLGMMGPETLAAFPDLNELITSGGEQTPTQAPPQQISDGREIVTIGGEQYIYDPVRITYTRVR